jgi:hypothetical protein
MTMAKKRLAAHKPLIQWLKDRYKEEGKIQEETINSYIKDCSCLLEALLTMFDSHKYVEAVFKAYGFKTEKTGYSIIKILWEEVASRKLSRPSPAI